MSDSSSRLLIASPQMDDPFFERSVVLVWHFDSEGAIGVIINRPISDAGARGITQVGRSLTLPDVLQLDPSVDLSAYAEREVNWGGPVDFESGTVLANGRVADEEGWNLPQGIAVTRSQETLARLVGEQADLRLCLGYAGWGPGQLDDEIAAGGWLHTDVDPHLLFDVPPQECWEAALATLGLSPAMIAVEPGEA